MSTRVRLALCLILGGVAVLLFLAATQPDMPTWARVLLILAGTIVVLPTGYDPAVRLKERTSDRKPVAPDLGQHSNLRRDWHEQFGDREKTK